MDDFNTRKSICNWVVDAFNVIVISLVNWDMKSNLVDLSKAWVVWKLRFEQMLAACDL